jgi:hypothetical protein
MGCKRVRNKVVCSGKRTQWWLDALYGNGGDEPPTELTVALTSDGSNNLNKPFITVKATFSAETTGLTESDFTVANGSVTLLYTFDDIVYYAEVTPNYAGSLSVQLLAGVTDSSVGGVANSASNALSYTTSVSSAEQLMSTRAAYEYDYSGGASDPFVNVAETSFITLSGTSGTANINIGGVNYLATFATNLFTTAANFVTTHGAAIATAGFRVTSTGATTTGVITVTKLTNQATIINASGNLAGTVSNGDIPFAASNPVRNANGIDFAGAEYYTPPISPIRTHMIAINIPNIVTGFLHRSANGATQIACNFQGTTSGIYASVNDVRINGAVAGIANPSSTASFGGIKGNWLIYTFESSLIPTTNTRFGANNSSVTSVLTDGQFAYHMSWDFVLTQTEKQNAHNYMVKKLIAKSLGFSVVQLPTLIEVTATLDDTRYATPGSPYIPADENTHPDVLDMEVELGAGQTWNGHRYWMAWTPYPGNLTSTENPSIAAADNLNYSGAGSFSTPAGVTNPVVPAIGGGYNSDNCLLMVPSTGYMHLYWRYYDQGTGILTTLESHSNDGWATRSADKIMYSVNILTNPELNELSPAVFYDPNLGLYVLYAVLYLDGAAAGRNILVRHLSATPDGFTADFETCLTPSFKLMPWHTTVQWDAATSLYYAFPGCTETGGSAGNHDGYCWTSVNGRDFYEPRATLIPHQVPVPSWQSTIYRISRGIRTAGGFILVYSASGKALIGDTNQHRLFKTTLTLP